MPPTVDPLSGRYLSFAEQEEIAVLRARWCGVREIARQLGRSPSTISREMRRNAATRGGGLEYRASTAQRHADRRGAPSEAGQARSERVSCAGMCGSSVGVRGAAGWSRDARSGCSVDRPASLSAQVPVLGKVVEPEQISNRLRVGSSPMMSRCGISHEAIYQSLYVQGRARSRRELTACPRTGRALRVPRALGGRARGS